MRALLAKSKYVLLYIIGGLVAGALLIPRILRLMHPTTRPDPSDDADLHIHYPRVPRFIAEKIDKASEQATIIRAEARAKSEVQKAELSTIVAIPSGAERRRRLAEFMAKV